jgi:predicted transcriptional regulator
MLTIGAKADEESEKILQKMLVKKIKAQRKHKMLCEKILENYERKKGTVWEKAKEEKDTGAKIS